MTHIIGITLIILGILVFLISIITELETGIFISFMMILIGGMIAIFTISDKPVQPKYVFLPEEYKAIEAGDTLEMKKDGNVINIYFYKKGISDSDHLYIVKF